MLDAGELMGNNHPRVRDRRKITTTLRIDVGVVELVSVLAKHEGRTMSALYEDAILLYFERQSPELGESDGPTTEGLTLLLAAADCRGSFGMERDELQAWIDAALRQRCRDYQGCGGGGCGDERASACPRNRSTGEREAVSQVAPQRHFHVTLARGERLRERTMVGSTGRVTTGRTNVPGRDGHCTDAGEYRRAIAATVCR